MTFNLLRLFDTKTILVEEQKLYDIIYNIGGARCVMVIVVGNGHGDTSSNPRRN